MNRFDRFRSIPSPYGSDKSRPDLRTYAQKAYDYVFYLALEAGAEKAPFVRNALKAIKLFPKNHSIIERKVSMVEQRLVQTIDLRWRANSSLPTAALFADGVIVFGSIKDTKTVIKLRVDQLSGNVMVYGQYGMGKSNFNLYLIPQIIAQGVHVDIFDVTQDYRDLLQVAGCQNGLVLPPDNDQFNPLEPIGDPDEHLQFLWDITTQDLPVRPESRVMLYNYNEELYRKFSVYDGKEPPSLLDFINYLRKEKARPGTTVTAKSKIDTALGTLTYLSKTFKAAATCRRGYPLDVLDRFSFISYEIGNLSEGARSWYTKIKLRQYQHKGQSTTERHKVFRILIVDEAKNIFSKSRIGKNTNFIKDMFTRSRSIGCWWIISDQFPSELADFIRACSVQISFAHTVPKEIREIAAGMGCTDAQKKEIPRLGRYHAYQKITDFPSAYIMVTHKSAVQRHIGDDELRRLMSRQLDRMEGHCKSHGTAKKVHVVTKGEGSPLSPQVAPKDDIPSGLNKTRPDPLVDLKDFLRFAFKNPGMNLTSLYKSLNISGRRGDSLKNHMIENGLAEELSLTRGNRGRPSKTLKITEKGRQYLNEK